MKVVKVLLSIILVVQINIAYSEERLAFNGFFIDMQHSEFEKVLGEKAPIVKYQEFPAAPMIYILQIEDDDYLAKMYMRRMKPESYIHHKFSISSVKFDLDKKLSAMTFTQHYKHDRSPQVSKALISKYGKADCEIKTSSIVSLGWRHCSVDNVNSRVVQEQGKSIQMNFYLPIDSVTTKGDYEGDSVSYTSGGRAGYYAEIILVDNRLSKQDSNVVK